MRKLLSIGLVAVCIVFFNLGALAQEVDVNKGIELYKKALDVYENKQYDEAIQYSNEAYTIALESGEEGKELKTNLETLIPQLYYIKATNLVTEKKFDEAIAGFNEATVQADKFNAVEVKENINKSLPQLYMAIANSKLEANDLDGAIANVEKALELDPNNPSVYLYAGVAYLKKGNLNKAEEDFLKSIELAKQSGDESIVKNATPQVVTINLLKAQEATKTKKWNDVYTFAEKALSYGDNINGYKLKGAASIQLKRWDAAIDSYTKIADASDKDKPSSYYYIALSYEGKKNTTKACEYYKKLTNDPNFKAVAEHKIKVELKCK